MVNDVSRRIDAFEAGGHHPYRSSLVPPEVEHAARIGNVGPVQQYLQAGKDPNARSVYQSQLLHVAARQGQTDVLKVLVKAAGIDIMALDYVSTFCYVESMVQSTVMGRSCERHVRQTYTAD